MNTDQLISMLASQAGAAPRAVVARRLGPALALGGLVSVLLVTGAFLTEGDKFFRCDGAFCTKTACALLLEKNKVFRGDGPFCNKGNGAFLIDGNIVFLAEGPFCNKTDAIFNVQGDVPMIALMAILAGH